MVKQKTGFTLIELLVVVLIIGILAAVALPQYQKTVRKTRTAEAYINLRALHDAQRRHFLETGRYAASLNELDIEAPQSDYYTFGINGNTATPYKMMANPRMSGLPLIEFYADGSNARICLWYDSDTAAEQCCYSLGVDPSACVQDAGYTYCVLK
ncbi:pili assembly chaperone [Bacteroidia bacterium]|nr:pili assembly chaperone [Bacteroidia bacterium]